MRRRLLTLCFAFAGVAFAACAVATSQPPPEAEATAHSSEAARRSPVAYAFTVIEGDLAAYDAAEEALVDAYHRDRTDATTMRTLARMLNVRLTRNDFSKAGLQAELYLRLLEREVGPEEAAVETLPQELFAFHCFAEMAAAADLAYRGNNMQALSTVRRLERSLAARRHAHPNEIETHAMAGNYWLNLTAVLPVGKHRRLEQAIEALEIQQARWSEQDVLSQGLGVAPGTRAVFATWLAELLIANRQPDQAMNHFRRVADLGAHTDATPAMQSLGAHARTRLAQSASGHLAPETLPPWPRAATSCVACHSQTRGL